MTATNIVTALAGGYFAWNAFDSFPENGTPKDVINKIINFAFPTLCAFGGGWLANHILPPTTPLKMIGGVGIQLTTGIALVVAGVFIAVSLNTVVEKVKLNFSKSH